MKTYLFAVQDATGRELLSWTGEVEKVSTVKVVRDDGKIALMAGREVLGSVSTDQGELTLHRWPADDKLSEPVSHPISD